MTTKKKLDLEETIPIGKAIKGVFDHLYDRQRSRTHLVGLETPFLKLDRRLRGIQAGHLIVLAGDKRSNPSDLAKSIVLHACPSCSVLYCGEEGSSTSIAEAMLCAESGIAFTDEELALFDEKEWFGLTDAASELASRRLFFSESSEIELSWVDRAVRQFLSEAKPPKDLDQLFPEMPEALIVVEDVSRAIAVESAEKGDENNELKVLIDGVKRALLDTNAAAILVIRDQAQPRRMTDGTLETDDQALCTLFERADVVLYVSCAEDLDIDLDMGPPSSVKAHLEILKATNGNRGHVALTHEPYLRRYLDPRRQGFPFHQGA